jgi:hypothetical protein
MERGHVCVCVCVCVCVRVFNFGTGHPKIDLSQHALMLGKTSWTIKPEMIITRKFCVLS